MKMNDENKLPSPLALTAGLCVKQNENISCKTASSLPESEGQSTGMCGHCKRILPLGEFYYRKKGKRDSYCKACRKASSKLRYRQNIVRTMETIASERRDLTEIENRRERIEMIRRAKVKVYISIRRKSERMKQAELDAFPLN